MLKRRKGCKKKMMISLRIVLKVKQTCQTNNKRKITCKLPAPCRKKEAPRRRPSLVFSCPPKHCKGHKSIPWAYPIPLPSTDPPVKTVSNLVVNKECCGNILIQGEQPGFYIWESDVDSNITIAQISIFSSSSSTQALEVKVDGTESKILSVPPGSTINFIGQGTKSIYISAQATEMTYVEGKYVISTTLQVQSESDYPIDE
ncbi:S-Ena type endospore appendage [Paenibacillus sp. P36]|uniref:S-Ena type endospore appendage n=1 Tax=Paenibacillus sp. P36 TaxID=3342538 RepID=UPI0038B328F5